MPSWGFRVATDPSAGGGHLARCMPLADALDGNAIFFVDPDCPDQTLLRGITGRVITEQRHDDASAALRALASDEVTGLVIDSYAITEESVTKAAAAGFAAVFRDDGVRGAEHLSIEIGAAYGSGEERIAAGPGFAPLAPGYTDAWRRAHAMDGEIFGRPRILIAFGQRDSADLTTFALSALRTVRPRSLLTCVLGAGAPHLQAVAALIGSSPDAELVVSPSDMIEIYLSHDLAVGAPGVSQLERMCCGLPSILLCQSAAQTAAAKAWQDQRCAELLDLDAQLLAAAAGELLANHARRRAMRRAGLALVDGRGLERLAARLESELSSHSRPSGHRRSAV